MSLSEQDYVTALQNYIKDHTIKNILLKYQVENTPEELLMYVQMAIGFLNAIPPPVLEYTYGTFPIPSLIVHQAAIECLISNGVCHARNELTYNNGGITVKIHDSERYMKYIQILIRMTDLEISNFTKLKVAININGGWGGVHSPYGRLHGGGRTLQPSSLLSG